MEQKVMEMMDGMECESNAVVQESAKESKEAVTDEWLTKLQNGEVDTNNLSNQDRRWYVERLTQEGMLVFEMARLLGVSERTIGRDRAALRRGSSLEPSLKLGDELLGEMQKEAFETKQELIRLARDPKTPAYARLWARAEACRTQERFIQTAMKLGYLEKGTQRLERVRETLNHEVHPNDLTKEEKKHLSEYFKYVQQPTENFKDRNELEKFKYCVEKSRCIMPVDAYMGCLERYARRGRELIEEDCHTDWD